MDDLFKDMLKQSALVDRIKEDLKTSPYPMDGSRENKRAWLVGNMMSALEELKRGKFSGLGIKNADFLDAATALLALEYITSMKPGSPASVVSSAICLQLTAYMHEMSLIKIVVDKYWGEQNGGEEE